mgnify:CR=1 FL=1
MKKCIYNEGRSNIFENNFSYLAFAFEEKNNIQIININDVTLSNKNSVEKVYNFPERGYIYDRNNKLIVGNEMQMLDSRASGEQGAPAYSKNKMQQASTPAPATADAMPIEDDDIPYRYGCGPQMRLEASATSFYSPERASTKPYKAAIPF